MNKPQLEDYTNKELKDEIEKREKNERKLAIPKPLASYNPLPIEEICRNYIAFMASDDYHEDNDWDNYIYEVALQTVYGDSIWEWIREQMA